MTLRRIKIREIPSIKYTLQIHFKNKFVYVTQLILTNQH